LTSPSSRLSRRSAGDLRIIRGAATRIAEQGHLLDRELQLESRAAERMRLLRQATGQITRAANDAIHAYRRVTAGLEAECRRADTDPSEVAAMERTLSHARQEMLDVLEVASQRYPWAKPWRASFD
jgi:hypothetical protein